MDQLASNTLLTLMLLLDCHPAVVPPGYFVPTQSTMTSCTAGYFREGWLMYNDPKASSCTPCGENIDSEPRDLDENPLVANGTLTRATPTSCCESTCYCDDLICAAVTVRCAGMLETSMFCLSSQLQGSRPTGRAPFQTRNDSACTSSVQLILPNPTPCPAVTHLLLCCAACSVPALPLYLCSHPGWPGHDCTRQEPVCGQGLP